MVWLGKGIGLPITKFVEPVRYRAVTANLCLMLRLLAALLAVPAGVAVLAGEFRFALVFAGLAGASLGLGLLGRLAGQPNLEGKEAFVVTALAYLVFSLFGAAAFLPVESFVDGFFESMSGFTTTGLSVTGLAGLPRSLLFFRGYSQWIGGIGIVILTLIVLRVPGRAARKLYTQEFSGEKPMAGIRKTARLVLLIYASLTAVGFGTFVLAGMRPFDALLNILATVSTGGFSPHAQSIGAYPAPAVHGAVIVFMILGATGFPLYYFLIREGPRRVLRDSQLLVLLGLGLAAACLFWVAWQAQARLISSSLFQSFSALTTTGFSTVDYARWPPLVKGLSVVLMICGGSSFSTAGGIKLIRLIVLFKLVRWSVVKRVLPDAATVSITAEKSPVSESDLKNAVSLIAIYLLILAGTSLIFLLSGFGIVDSVFENASALGTVGLSSGITSSGLPLHLKLVLMFNMWAGRLEILPALIIFIPAVWPRRRNR